MEVLCALYIPITIQYNTVLYYMREQFSVNVLCVENYQLSHDTNIVLGK